MTAAIDLSQGSEPTYRRDEILIDWNRPGFEIDTDSWLIQGSDGTAAFGQYRRHGERHLPWSLQGVELGEGRITGGDGTFRGAVATISWSCLGVRYRHASDGVGRAFKGGRRAESIAQGGEGAGQALCCVFADGGSYSLECLRGALQHGNGFALMPLEEPHDGEAGVGRVGPCAVPTAGLAVATRAAARGAGLAAPHFGSALSLAGWTTLISSHVGCYSLRDRRWASKASGSSPHRGSRCRPIVNANTQSPWRMG